MIKLNGLTRVDSKTINNLQVVSYAKLQDGIYNAVITTVRTGKTMKGTVIFSSPDPVVAETFATMHPELIERYFVHSSGEGGRAWFSKQYPTHMFGTEQYDKYRGHLVRFDDPLPNEPKGYIKIH